MYLRLQRLCGNFGGARTDRHEFTGKAARHEERRFGSCGFRSFAGRAG
jgi:hypothetical protein